MKKQKATIDGIEIRVIARWARNGRKYEWLNPTQEQAERLIKKYDYDQITPDGILWLQW